VQPLSPNNLSGVLRQCKTKITGDTLDSLFDEYFKDKTDADKVAIKKKYGTELAILEAPQRIRWICLDIIKHNGCSAKGFLKFSICCFCFLASV
jgi:hypothetical protein